MKIAEDLIQQEYDSVEKIGHGSFGHIFQVKSKKDGKYYACKVEKTSSRKTILVEKEFRYLTALMETPQQRFPLVYSLKQLHMNSYMIMERMDKSLDNIFEANDKHFDIGTIALIAYQTFKSLETLHRNGFLHRDIKPENIMTCIDSHKIKLIDFGLASPLEPKRSTALIGNVRYASRDAHLGYSSPKDDLEEMLYCIYYFFNGILPWQNSTADEIELEISRRLDYPNSTKPPEMTPILVKKHKFLDIFSFPTTRNKVKQLFFHEVTLLARIILNGKDKLEPNYKEINRKLQRLLVIAGVGKGSCFQWCPLSCPHKLDDTDYWSVLK